MHISMMREPSPAALPTHRDAEPIAAHETSAQPAGCEERLAPAVASNGEAPDGRIATSAPDCGPEGGQPAMERRLRRAISALPLASSPLAVEPPAAVPTIRFARASASVAAAADAAILERLNFSLTEWVDEDKARAYVDCPSGLLTAVARQRHRVVPEEFAKTLDPSRLADEAVLDEAAVLYDRLRRRTVAQDASAPAMSPTLAALRATFMDALRADYAKRRLLDALFVPSLSLGQATPYFDGFALRNVEGKSFDDLVEAPSVWADSAFDATTQAQRRTLLAEKFDEMAESTRFPIGSIAHSMATALLRINRYRGEAPSDISDETALVKAFTNSEDAWKEGDSYPYHPRVLFATHLARCSGLDVLSLDHLRLLYENQVSDPALEALASGNGVAAQWLARHLSQGDSSGVRWKEAKPARQTEVLLGVFDALRAAAETDSPIAPFARTLRDKGVLLRNRLVGVDFEARASAVLEYANERMILAYGRPPVFDRYAAAAEVLRRLGADDEALTEERHYVIVGDNPHVTKSAFGNRVDEFLDRADWTGLTGAFMTLPGGTRLTPRDELQREEEAFNTRLRSDPWVLATAKARLREQFKAVTHATVQPIANEIAGTVETETESHRALMRGLDTWLNTVPIVGPLYNIEEGVRHKDAARAAFGLLFLGADVFDLTTGAGGPSARTGHPIVPKFRRALAHVDASTVNMSGHAELIEMSVDPVHIGLPDADVPAQWRALARQSRENNSVRWRDYDVVHLDNEDRIVPVRREGDRYVEVDWRTGHRMRDSLSIELDPDTGKAWAHRVRARDRGADASAVRGSDVRERMTVKSVTGLLDRANDVTPRDFDVLFSDAFISGPPASAGAQFDAPEFYRKLYRSSSTFRRLFNRHAQLDARLRNGTASPWKKWEFVVGEAGPLGPPRKAYTDFEHKRIYMPRDTDIEAMPYISAGGVRTMTCEQAYVHEMVHALTGARDPERALDMLNRGPVVYLTDKILNEAGYDIAEQVMYRRQNSVSDMPPDQTVEYNTQAAARAAQLENRYLDAVVDGKRDAVNGRTLVEGLAVAERPTVQGAKAALDAIEGDGDEMFLAWGDFKAKFDKNFGFYVQNRTMTTGLASDAMVVVDFYSRLYERSVTFRRMFDKMPVTDATQADPWRFVLEGDIDFEALSPGGRAHGVSVPDKKIYVLDDGMQYLTEAGLSEVEIERKLAYQMICAMTGLEPLAPALGYANRGPAVYLTDRVLKEAGFNYPRQLAAALAAPDDAAAQAQLLAYQTSALRSAAVEDRYLKLG